MLCRAAALTTAQKVFTADEDGTPGIDGVD